jgi:hypothetical protein
MPRAIASHLCWLHLCWLGLGCLAACGAGGTERSGATTDSVPPQAGSVADGLGDDVDRQPVTSPLAANWSGFADDSGRLDHYEWAIGTTPGGTELQDWTAVGLATVASNAALVPTVGTTCYVAVRAYDAAGNASAIASSDGTAIEADGGSGGGGGQGPVLATVLSQFGISWQFAAPAPVGRFANGDWWVQGPVDIVDITPRTQEVAGRQIHGSMRNPTTVQNGEHGYDSLLFHPYENGRYQPALNVALGVSPGSPLRLSGGDSLISTISYLGTSLPPNGSFSQLQTAAVLTVLPSAPPPGAFRPPYAGHDKTVRHFESQLDYQRLLDLAPPNGTPELAVVAAGFERVWLDHMSGWSSRYLHPIDNMPDYGRDFTSLYGTGALLLQLDLPAVQKRDLLVRLVQIGIDFFGNVQQGASWEGVGGQCSGRKFPILFAGAMLADPAMLAIGQSHPSGYFGPGHPNNRSQFGEDCQTFYVRETSFGVFNWGFGNYGPSHRDLPEWGNKHTSYPTNDDANWGADPYRRCCTANAWVGQTLVARLLGLRQAWNHPAYFDYMDRYLQTEPAGEWTRSWDPWHAVMWDSYRSGA